MLTFHPSNDGAPAAAPWIDLLNPRAAEVALVEDHTGLRIPEPAELRRIDRSSQMFAEGQTLRLAAPVVAGADTDASIPVLHGHRS